MGGSFIVCEVKNIPVLEGPLRNDRLPRSTMLMPKHNNLLFPYTDPPYTRLAIPGLTLGLASSEK